MGTQSLAGRAARQSLPLLYRGVLVLAILVTGLTLALPCGAPHQQTWSLRSPAPHALVPQIAYPFRLAPDQQASYSLFLKSGEYAEASIQQTEGLFQAELIGPDGKKSVPHLLDAGKGSAIQLPVVADLDGLYRVRICLRVAATEGLGSITVSTPHRATALDREQAWAWDHFAEGEWIRKTGTPGSQTEALHDYDAAYAAAESLKDWKLARAALTGKARVLLFNLADYPPGREAIQKAVDVPGASEDASGEALAWKTLSSADSYLGDYTATIVAANKSLALFKTTGDLYWQGIVLGNIAYAYRETGENENALAAGEAALKIARSIDDLVGVDFDLGALAATQMARGNYEQALNFYYQALVALKQKPYTEGEANDWLGLGDVYEQLGDTGRARTASQKALEVSEKAHDTSDELGALGFLGEIALGEHHPSVALGDYTRGLATAESQQLRPEQASLLVQLSRGYAAEEERGQAMASAQRALGIATKISEPAGEAEALQAIGDIEASSGQFAKAITAYRHAYAIWSAEGHRARMGASLASLARAEFEMGNLTAADRSVSKALSLVESARATISSRELRTSYFASRHSYYDLAVAVLMALDRRHPGDSYSAKALAMAERAKARTLLDEIESSGAPAFAGVPASLVTRQRILRERLNAAYDRLRDAIGAEPESESAVRRIEAQIEDLLHESDRVEARMRDATPRYAALAGGKPASLSGLESEAAGPRRALLEYWAGERESFLWIVTQHGLTMIRLPPSATLARLIRQYRGDLLARAKYPAGEGFVRRHERIATADARSNHEALELGTMLLGRASNLPGIQTLVIVPDGPLWQVPFSALRLPPARGRAGAASDFREFAAARFRIAEEPSASVLLSLMRRGGPVNYTPRVAIFADPVYTDSDPRLRGHILLAHSEESRGQEGITRMVTEAGMGNLPRLMGSRQEALEIAALAGSQHSELRMGFDAQPAAVLHTDWSRYNIAHFAAHAMINPVHPAFSGIVLSMVDRHGDPEDGVLWMDDIYSLHMPVSLVVLSGCRTAAGRDIPGEGIAGLSRAFFFAGADRVLGSLWSIEDRETGALMQDFYFNLLKQHLPAALALQAAQVKMAKSKQWGAPYFWAGFILQGSPE